MKNALVISQFMEPRLRIQQLLELTQAFSQVESAHDFDDAETKLRSFHSLDYVFISAHFDHLETAEFIEVARANKTAKKSAYILITHSNTQAHELVANNMILGIHAFLCEPLSIDTLSEVCGLATAVKAQTSHTRLRAAAGLMISDVLDEFGDKFGPTPTNLWDRVKRSCEAYKEVTGESLSNIVVNKLCEVPPSKRVADYDGASKRVRSMVKEKFRTGLKTLQIKVSPKES